MRADLRARRKPALAACRQALSGPWWLPAALITANELLGADFESGKIGFLDINPKQVTVDVLRDNGVEFLETPDSYYDEALVELLDVPAKVLPAHELDTDRLKATMSGAATKTGQPIEVVMEARKATVPARRFGNPDEFGATCAFLCSRHAGYITGQNVLIDGGAFPGTF